MAHALLDQAVSFLKFGVLEALGLVRLFYGVAFLLDSGRLKLLIRGQGFTQPEIVQLELGFPPRLGLILRPTSGPFVLGLLFDLIYIQEQLLVLSLLDS